MKKGISLLLCVMILSCLMMTACGGSKKDLSDSKYVGTWKCIGLSFKEEQGELGSEYTLTLNGDGTGEFVSEEGTDKITWELTNDGFKTKGDTKLTFKDDGDNIKANVIGVDLIFEKQ